MKRFMRNIRGSKFWERGLALLMVLVVTATLIPMDLNLAKAAETTIFTGTTITMSDLNLKAVYTDETGTHVIEMVENVTNKVPYDADINMRLDFLMGNGDAIEVGKEYVYQLPDTIRVDVEAEHQLADENGTSIGVVHISKDGTLVFTFNDSVLNNTSIPFYVQFDGGFSQDLQEEGKEADITFPTSSGDFTLHVETTGEGNIDVGGEVGPIDIAKSGAQIVNVDGKDYIEWTVSLGPNGRESIDGVIIDNLANGLTYAKVDGYPKMSGNSWGNDTAQLVDKSTDGGTTVEIEVSDCKPDYRTNVSFLTTYDKALFTGTITENSAAMVDNTVVFNPDDGTTGVSASTSVNIVPDMVRKSGSAIDTDGNITWTVVLNAEGLDLNGTTYTDTLGSGMELVDGSISSTAGTVNTTSNGFTVRFDSSITGPVTITYKTKVTDFSQTSYENTADLDGDSTYTYDVHKTATVPGINLISKSCTAFNALTKTFTWNIVVNAEGREINNAVVTDSFDSNQMEFVSAVMDGNALTPNVSGGTVTMSLGNINEAKTITVTTRLTESYVESLLNDPNYKEDSYYEFKNTASLKSDLNSTPVSSTASRWTQVKSPDLITKSGEFTKVDNQPLNDGTIKWIVTVNEPQLGVEGMHFSDIIPAGMEYVDGSFCIQNLWEWNDANRVYLVPVVGSNGETIAYDFQTSDDRVAPFLAKSFQIVYITKITDADTGVKKDASFTNSASVTVDFDGDITVKDTAVSTVTGTPGGTLDKEYSYKPGTDYVDWTVTINEARNNMEDIENPILRDQLAEYFDYVSGTLYRMDADGNLSAVTEPYYATAINNQLIVQLPDIGSDCLVFKFRTRFNVLAAELNGQKIQNSVALKGEGHLYENQSNAIENVAFSSSSAGSSVKREIRIKKTDASTGNPLAGAEFELLLGTEVIATAVSGDDGYAVFEISGAGLDLSQNYTFKLKETIAPDGYQVADTPPSGYQYDSNKAIIINDCTEANLKTSTDGTKYYELVVPNASINDSTEIIIQKKDNSTPQLALSGALFGLYSDSNCTNLVAKRTSDAEGKVVFSGIKIDGDTGNATYYVKEITPPAGYKINNSLVEVNIEKNGTGIYVVTYSFDGNVDQTSCTLIDEKALGTYTITKTDTSSPAQVLPDAEFGLYRDALCRDLITTVTTDASGKATFTDLELGKTYYYRENVAPDGYVLDSTIRSFVVGTGLENDDVHDEITITNEAQVGRIVVTKVDNNVPAKPLAGVEFTLYESTGNTPVSIPGVTNPVTTDSSGIAVFNDIPFGEYVLKETDGLAGYKVAADQNVIVNQLDDTEITVVNEIIYIDVVVNKTDNASPAQPLSGAEFGLYANNGMCIRSGTTDANGYLIFEDVPYGDYYLEEIEAPEGYTKWTGQENISKSAIDDKIEYSQPLIFEYTITNAKQNGSIVITKVDNETIPNPVAGAEFILYDENMLIVDRAFSDTDGKITFSELKYGTYYIEEIKAPEGYIRDTGVYKVIVNSDMPVTAYESGTTVNGSGSLIIVNEKLEIITPLISFKLKKVDESGKPLADAVFELYADGVGTGITMTSDASGMVYFRRITVTNYSEDTVFSVREVSSPSGYTMDSVNINLGTKVASPYADSDDVTKWLSDAKIQWAGDGSASNAEIENRQILGNIWVTKTGLLSTLLLPGAEITLYEADGITPVSITGVTNPVVTNNQGVATFANLPVGTYYVKETKAPAGYTLNTTAQKVVVTESKTYEVSIKDSPILVYVSKQSLTGVTELPGAQMSIRKNSQDGTIVYSYTTSDTVERIPASLLETGTTYYIVEEQAPNGYGYMEPVGFTVANDGTITISGGELKGNTIVVRDRKIDLSISKRDSANQTNELSGAIFGLYDENGVEVERFTSGTSAYNLTALVAPKSGYTQYTIKEITAPDGYETAAPVKFAVKYDGTIYTIDDATGAYVLLNDTKITILNTLKPPSTIYIRKIDGVTGLDLGGAEFVIRDNAGNPKKFAEWSSDGTIKSFRIISVGEPEKNEELRQDEQYRLVEVDAPKGYLPAEDIVFSVNSSGEIIIEGNPNCLNYQKDTITIENYSIAVNIRKQNGFGTLLKGAKLRIAEYDVANGEVGQTIFEFESNNLNPTLVDNSVLKADKRLVAGKTYVLQELEAPDGYQLADDIVFTIGLDGVITRVDGVEVHGNTIVMEDEEAGLAIGKVSLEEQVGLAGCKLEVTTVDDPYFQTMTWVSDGKTKTWDFLTFTPGCTYVLTELEAPDGYAYTDPITFKIGLDDNKVYIVEDGTEKAVKDRTVYIADGILKLSVDKLDSLDNTYVEGATLAVLDSAGNECVRFTTGDGRIDVDTSKLIAGNGYVTDVDTNPDAVKEYTLREVEAPESHYKAVDIRFAIDRDGQIFIIEELAGVKDYIAVDENLLTMYDAPKFSISKQDIAGAEVPGATITITTTEDDNFQTIEFVSGTVPKYFEDGTFTPGITYTLTETNAPDGYAYAESITFKFDADGNLFINGKKSDGKQVVMVDNALAVMISKQDITNSKELAGAKLVIKNEAGEVIHSFVSTNTPTLLPHTLFVAPKPGEMSYYSLTELTAPDGYEIAETIYFALDSSGQVYVKGPDGTYQLMDDNTVVMFDQPTITSGTGISKTPLTGDQVRMKLAILLGMISLFSALVLIERSIFKK